VSRFGAGLDAWVGRVLVALMAAAVLNVLWQVASRFVLGDPSSYTDELARYLLVWIGVLGAAHVTGQKRHLAIEVLPLRFGARGRARLGLAVEAAVAVFAAGVLVFGGGRLVLLTFELEQRSAALGIPLGLVYLVLPISGALVMLHCARAVAGHRHALGGGERGADA
jgi:TRAP-type C4-dicarboxylate transport system permease small subunit